MTTKQLTQSREHLQVEWLLFSLNENTQKLARNYKMLPFEWRALRKKMTTKQFEQSRELNGFYFPSMKIHKSWLEITKCCHLSFQKL